MGSDKERDMEIYERKGLINTHISLHKVSSGTKKLEKSFHPVLAPKPTDYKEVIDYIKDNNINVINTKEFKWL